MHIPALGPEVAGPCLRFLRKVTAISSFGKLFAFVAVGYHNEFDQKFFQKPLCRLPLQ